MKQLLTQILLLAVCLGIVMAKAEAPVKEVFMDIPSKEVDGAMKGELSNSGSIEGNDSQAWLISFLDDAQSAQFEAVTEYLKNSKRPITESVNESYIKFLVANMTKADFMALDSKKEEFGIESIRLDDEFWDSMDSGKSEL